MNDIGGMWASGAFGRVVALFLALFEVAGSLPNVVGRRGYDTTDSIADVDLIWRE